MMSKIDVLPNIPGVVVELGKKVNVLCDGNDLHCGDTTVVELNARTGSFKLANGYWFHADGCGHSNNKYYSVGPSRYPWNDSTLTEEEREAHLHAFQSTTEILAMHHGFDPELPDIMRDEIIRKINEQHDHLLMRSMDERQMAWVEPDRELTLAVVKRLTGPQSDEEYRQMIEARKRAEWRMFQQRWIQQVIDALIEESSNG